MTICPARSDKAQDLDLSATSHDSDRKGGIEPLKLARGRYEFPRVSPDGKHLTFGTDDGKEAIVWIYDLSGTTSMRPLTVGGRNRFPIWSADSERLAFQSDREGDLGIFWQRVDGTGAGRSPDQAGAGNLPFPGIVGAEWREIPVQCEQ